MMIFAPFALIGLVVAGLVIAGIVLLAVFLARRKALGVALGIAGGVLLLLMLPVAVFWLLAMPVVHRSVAMQQAAREGAVAEIEQARPPVPAPMGAEASGVEAADDMSTFLADVYPSREKAVQGVAESLAGSVATVSADEEGQLPAVRVTGQVAASLLQQAAEVLRRRAVIRTAEVVPTGGATPSPPIAPSQIVCEARADEGPQGAVQMVLTGPKGQVTQSARFVAKPWLADIAGFLSESREGAVVAQSRRQCASPQEAQQAAIEDAVSQLFPRVWPAVLQPVAQGRYGQGVRLNTLRVQELIRAELTRGALVRDRFVQRFPRPYGDVWRHSLLVDASAARVDRLARDAILQAAGQRRAEVSTWLSTGASIGGLVVLIFALYLVLNAATKGYYVWVLRLAAVGLILGGAIVVLYVVRTAGP